MRAVLFVATLIGCAGCDHVTKEIARGVLADLPPLSFAADTVRFELAHNAGGFLSFGDRLPAALGAFVFLVLVPFGLVLLSLWVLRWGSRSAWSLPGLALLVGGGAANWIDRIAHGGQVTDFMSVGLGRFRTGIFNVADVSVMVGAIVVLLAVRASKAERGEAA
jgi:signal peptidase II